MPSIAHFPCETVERSLRSDLEQRARARGALSLRVTSAREDGVALGRLREAFARGDFATWPYGEPYAKKSATPQTILAGAQSVVCIAMPYAAKRPPRLPLSGMVSNYAWSHDYHREMKSVLRELASMIDAHAGRACSAIACDTAPIAERAFAARAGLGWVGKHTNLIDPQFGSFVFLGEIVTTQDLAPDEPLKKSCGACVRCVHACPTQALRGDYTIDATRCISDLTQRGDAIPRDLRPFLGEWVWGCDICQDVCPPTMQAGIPPNGGRAPRDGAAAAPDLQDLLVLTSAEFKRTYRTTAMGWRGPAVLRRNAAVALGNVLDRATVPALVQALEAESNPMVRRHITWALGRIGSPPALAALRTRLNVEEDHDVRAEIALSLEPFDHVSAF